MSFCVDVFDFQVWLAPVCRPTHLLFAALGALQRLEVSGTVAGDDIAFVPFRPAPGSARDVLKPDEEPIPV